VQAIHEGSGEDTAQVVVALERSERRAQQLDLLSGGEAGTNRPTPRSRRWGEQLQEAASSKELARVVGRYARTELVCLDELGYLSLPDGAAELVFQVLSELHERGSLIVTTNLPFGEWTKVFPDARMAKAVVDRLTHRAHIIDTGTESWRFRHGLNRKT